MATGFGTNAWIGLGAESTYGTAVSRTAWFRILSESLKGENPTEMIQFLSSAVKRYDSKGKKSASGSVTMAVPYEGFGIILKHLLGSAGAAGGGPYTHTFTDGALPTGLTVEINRDAANVGSAYIYEGCKIRSAKFSQGLEGFLNCELDFLGEVEATGAVSTPTFPTDTFMHWTHVDKVNVNSGALSGKLVEIEIINELTEDRYVLGSQLRLEPKRRNGMFKAKIDVELSAVTQTTNFLANTLVPLEIGWANGASQDLEFDVTNCAYQVVNQGVGGNGEIIQTIELEADLDDLTATLINSDASY